ncbi:MAG: hypothetical protein ABI067_06980 [Leifsonia sp.]
MSVSVTNGSLDFVSTLDNSDFQAKSLQDLKLIELRLQLTGDISGVAKYDEAVKAALATETKLRADLAKILDDAKIQTQDFIRTVQQPSGKTVFSDSAAEAEAYTQSLKILGDTGNVALSGTDVLLQQFNADFAAGVITIEQYQEAINAMAEAQVFFNQQVIGASAPLEEELGIVENLKVALIELRAENITILDPEQLAISNARIQELEAEISRATNVGKLGFDEFGVKIAKTNVQIEESIGLIGKLEAELTELKASKINIIDPVTLAKTNAKIQETEANIVQLNNVGKTGFDELGNKVDEVVPKVGKFQAAINRVTDVQIVGARVVTQFTRQIISLGVGFLSLEIGAKAIQSLIEYISNLDAFTGRLDQAKQNLLAFQEINKDADQNAGKQLGTLKELYDAATNVNNAMSDRIAAAQALRKEDAATFANASALTIVNGQLKQSYDELTLSIIAQAKSAAASSKIQALEGEKLDAKFLIDQNNASKAEQLRQAQIDYQNNLKNPNQSFLAQALTKQAQNPNGGNIVAPGVSINSALDLYKAEISAINKATNELNLKPSQDLKVKSGVETFLEGYVLTISKKDTDLKNANKLLGNDLQNFDNLISKVNDKTDLDNIKKALQEKLDSLTPSDTQYSKVKSDLQKVDDLEKQYQVKASTNKVDPAISAGQALLAQQTSLLQNVDALKAKYASKEEDRNQQAVDNLKATFLKQFDAIVAFNQKRQDFIDKYNRTHKGGGGEAYANSIGLVQQDTGQLQTSETGALAGLSGTQSLEQTKDTISKQKILFQEYEDFKLKAGTDAANKLFANDLGGYTSYIDYLKSLQPSETDLTSADPYTKARANSLSDYLKVEIPKANNEELKLQQKHLQDLIIQDQSYQEKRLTLITQANEAISILDKAGDTSGSAQAKINLQKALTTLDVTGFENSEKYKKLFTDITQLSRSSAISMIDDAEKFAKAQVDSGAITVDAYNKIILALAKLKDSEQGLNADDIISIGNQLTTLGNNFQGINSGVSGYISQLGGMVTALGSVEKEASKLQDDISSGQSTTSDYIGLIGTAVSGVVSLISSITSAAAARKKAAADYYNSVITFQQQYNVALDQQVQLQYQTDGNIFFTNTAQELSDAAKAYSAASAQYQQSLVALQAGKAIVKQKDVIDGSAVAKDATKGAVAGAAIGAVLGAGVLSVPAAAVGAIVGGLVGGIVGLFSTKKANVLTPLLQQYPQLIEANGKFNESLAKTLVANNQVDDATKVLLNNTIAYYDEEKAALDQITQALTNLVGQLGNNISDALVNAFENGQDAAKAFGTTVSDVLSKIVQQDLFEAIFGPQLTALQQKLTADSLANDGNTSAEIIADIENFYKTAGPLVTQFTQSIQAAQAAGASQGLTLFPTGTGNNSASSLSGGIQASITENTANILAGALNGIQLNTLTANNILQGHSLTFGQLLSIAQDQLTAVLSIQINTKRTADNSDLMTLALDAIAQNTKSNIGDQLRAAGKLGF